MFARMLEIGAMLILIAAVAPAAYSAQGDTGRIKGKTTVKSTSKARDREAAPASQRTISKDATHLQKESRIQQILPSCRADVFLSYAGCRSSVPECPGKW